MARNIFQQDRTLSPSEAQRFENLRKETYGKVYNAAYRMSNSRSDAEDLTQDAFLRAYRSFKDFEGDRPFENWILRIVSRLFLDLNRSRKRRVKTVSSDNPLITNGGEDSISYEAPDSSMDPEEVFMKSQMSDAISKAFQRLTPQQQLLVSLAHKEELSYNDISYIMGCPDGTIRSRLHRIHKEMREMVTAYREAERTGSVPILPRTRKRLSLQSTSY